MSTKKKVKKKKASKKKVKKKKASKGKVKKREVTGVTFRIDSGSGGGKPGKGGKK